MPGFEFVGQTVFESLFGGKEVAAILERDSSASEAGDAGVGACNRRGAGVGRRRVADRGRRRVRRPLARSRIRRGAYDRFWVVFTLTHPDGSTLFPRRQSSRPSANARTAFSGSLGRHAWLERTRTLPAVRANGDSPLIKGPSPLPN